MSSLRDKLQRLSAPQPQNPRENPGNLQLLDDLRQKMEAMRTGTSRAASSEPSRERHVPGESGQLPFVTERGLWIRRMTLGASHRVGSVDAHLALGADPAFLALLALDPGLAALEPRRVIYLDLETTGLGQSAVPFLVGLLHADGDTLTLEQILLRDLDDEAQLLAYVAERVAAASALITFNGKTFDWPLLRSRAVLARQPLPTPIHLDLLQIARRVHTAPNSARRVKLQQLEVDLLGIERVDDIAGADIGAAYWHWLRTGDDVTMRSVVDHNAWDVVAMAALVGLYGRPLGAPLAPGDARGLHDFLPQVAWTLQRAGATAEACTLAERAVQEEGSVLAHFTRAQIAKAMRDRDAALTHFAKVLTCEQETPHKISQKARLELSKLYEHHVRAYADAHAVAVHGTGEAAPALHKRLERLERKQSRGL